MKILKIFGLVAAFHAAVFMFIFAIPGCRSTGRQQAPAPAGADGTSPAAASLADPVMGSPVSADAGAPPQVLYSPTRPGTAAAVAVEAQTPDNVRPVSAYTVVKGDNLWSVSRKHGLTIKELAAANNIASSSPLRLGQKLIIPGKAAAPAAASEAPGVSSYTVKAGDTLSAIARHAGTTVTALKSLNKLRSNALKVGQVLELPSGGASAPAAATSAVSNAPARPAKSASSFTHVVKAGDTLGSIARKYQVSVGAIATANNIADPTHIRIGQKLTIPGWQAPAPAKASDASAPVPDVSTPAPVPAPAQETSPVAPSSEPPAAPAPSPDDSSPLVTPAAPDASATGAPVIQIEDSGAPEIN